MVKSASKKVTRPKSSGDSVNSKQENEPEKPKAKSETKDWIRENINTIYPLPPVELGVYVVLLAGVMCYFTYNLYKDSAANVEVLSKYHDLETGWELLGRKKDTSNFEWAFWSSWFLQLLPWYLGHVVIGKIVEQVIPKHRSWFLLTYSLISECFILGPWALLIILCHCVIAYLASLTKRVSVVWITCLALLSTLNFSQSETIMKKLISDDPSEKHFYLFVFSVAMCNMRYISFCLEQCNKIPSEESLSDSYSIFEMLTYVLYLPLFYTGPILTFDQFTTQLHSPLQPWTKERILCQIKDIMRIIFWALCTEIILHYLYFSAITLTYSVMESASKWTMIATGYWHGQFFQLKYIVMFGLPAVVAKFDQFEPPEGPVCISYVYLYSEMWKKFDRGLHHFLSRHIYFPLGGSRHGIARQFLAMTACFAFVFFWHGVESYLLVWIILNFIGITTEIAGGMVYAMEEVQIWESNHLSPAMIRRVRALAATPLCILSFIAIFIFFTGDIIGMIYFQRLILNGASLLTFIFFDYIAVQVAMEIKRYLASKTKAD